MLYSGFLEHLSRSSRGDLQSFHTGRLLLHTRQPMRRTSRCEDTLRPASSARHKQAMRPQQLAQHHAYPWLHQSSFSAMRHRRGKGSGVKLTGNKPNQSRAVTKGTRAISTVSHPTGWLRARNFHYNFSKGGRKGGKMFHKSHIKAPTQDALSHNQKSVSG